MRMLSHLHFFHKHTHNVYLYTSGLFGFNLSTSVLESRPENVYQIASSEAKQFGTLVYCYSSCYIYDSQS